MGLAGCASARRGISPPPPPWATISPPCWPPSWPSGSLPWRPVPGPWPWLRQGQGRAAWPCNWPRLWWPVGPSWPSAWSWCWWSPTGAWRPASEPCCRTAPCPVAGPASRSWRPHRCAVWCSPMRCSMPWRWSGSSGTGRSGASKWWRCTRALGRCSRCGWSPARPWSMQRQPNSSPSHSCRQRPSALPAGAASCTRAWPPGWLNAPQPWPRASCW